MSSHASRGSRAELTPQVVKSMNIAAVFRDHKAPVNAIDIHPNGEFIVTSGDDERIHVYSAYEGTKFKSIPCKKYGCSLIRYAPSERGATAVCASTSSWDDSLRYLNLEKNQYIRYFKGHRAKVCSLAMSPREDTFLSGSEDKTLRLWDLRINMCQGLLQLQGPGLAAWDPEGKVFCAVTSVPSLVRLYDIKAFDRGPFEVARLFDMGYQHVQWQSVTFSPDGKLLALTGDSNLTVILDSFRLTRVAEIRSRSGKGDSVECGEASFSPDSKYITVGGDNGCVYTYDARSGEMVSEWAGHVGAVKVLKWHPQAMMVASACTNICLWQPPPGKVKK